MLCDNCGKREANVRYSENINGRRKELNLCEECSKKFEGYTSPEDLKIMKDDYESQLETVKNENSSLKASQLRTKVANEFKLPTEMASRLQGATEEELRADAKTLAELVSTNKAVVLPLHDGSGGNTDKNAAIKGLLSQFKD